MSALFPPAAPAAEEEEDEAYAASPPEVRPFPVPSSCFPFLFFSSSGYR